MAKKRTRAKQALLDTALQLLSNNPDTSYLAVAKAARVGRATLYRHFPTREQLVEAVLREAIDSIDQAYQAVQADSGGSEEKLHAMVTALLLVADKLTFLTRFSHCPSTAEYEPPTRLQNELNCLISEMKREGTLDHSVSTEWIQTVIYTLVCSTNAVHGVSTVLKPPDASLIVRTVLYGLASDRPAVDLRRQ